MNDPGYTAPMNALGVGAVRFTLYWNETMPARGSFNWAALDYALDQVVGNGKAVYISVGENAPAWAAPCGKCEPYNYSYYGEYMEAVIRHTYGRYPNADAVFGVWNEPDLGNGEDEGEFLNDDEYARVYRGLFQAADAARDRVSTSIRLGAPETSHLAYSENDYFDNAMGQIAFYLHFTDIVTVHWYPGGPNLSQYMTFVASRAAGREVWLTEFGYPSCNDATQQSQIANVFNSAFDNLPINWTRAFLYRLWDGTNCEHAILRQNWTYRSAFTWYQNRISKIVTSTKVLANRVLYPDDEVVSPDGRFRLIYQWDGNLVLYRNDGYAMWSSLTYGTTPGYAVMQPDGNFVVYNASGVPVWATGTYYNSDAYLALQNNGALVLYRKNGSLAWKTPTGTYY